MTNEIFTIRSSIKTTLMRKQLLRGTILGGIGINFLLLAAVFFPLQEMRVWGPFFFIFGLGLITWGFFPYKRLKRLEEKPYCLTVNGNESLSFSSGENAFCSIPISSISHLDYVEKGENYGIAVFLKASNSKKIIIQDPDFKVAEFIERPRKQYGCDLYFPYFSQRGKEAIQERMKSEG